MRKLAVFFPGIGYTVDKPLLHYSRRLAAALGYEIKPVNYSGFPAHVLGDSDRMTECYRIALRQAQAQLAEVDWNAYEDILFIGKSVGTSIAAWIASKNAARSRIRQILFTPLEETFTFPTDRAIVFTGTNDPWVGGADTRIPALCEKRGIPCVVIPGGNHSLETADIANDLRALQRITAEAEAFLQERT